MSIEDLKKSVEMWVWDGDEDSVKMKIIHIDSENEAVDINGSWWGHYEEIKEPTYRPYNETDDLSLLVGKVVKAKEFDETALITAFSGSKKLLIVGDQRANFKTLFEGFVFLDNTPCGVKE